VNIYFVLILTYNDIILNKRLTKRKTNIGLAAQWYYSWNPSSEDEVAFIFEDDIEVIIIILIILVV